MVCLSIGKGLSIPTNYQNLSGFRTAYSETELRLAIAIAEAFIENGLGSGGGGGGGITQAQVQAAIEAATNLNGIEPSLSSIDTKTPALGANTAANSTPVTLANDGVFASNFGLSSEAAATSDTGNFSLIRLFKRLLSNGSRLLDSAGVIQASIKNSNIQPALTDTALVTATRDLIPVEYTFSGSGLNTNLSSSGTEVLDVTGFSHFTIQFSTITNANATVQVQATNDQSNESYWRAQALEPLTASVSSGSSTNQPFLESIIIQSDYRIFSGKIVGKFLRIRLTGYNSGTASAILILHRIPRQHDTLKAITNSILVSSISNAVTLSSNLQVKNQTYLQGTIDTVGDNTIIAAPGGSNRIFITAIAVQLEGSTATTVLFKSGSTSFRRLFCQSQGDGISLQYNPTHNLRLGVNEAFILNLSGANLVGYSVEYYIGT